MSIRHTASEKQEKGDKLLEIWYIEHRVQTRLRIVADNIETKAVGYSPAAFLSDTFFGFIQHSIMMLLQLLYFVFGVVMKMTMLG